MKENIIFGQAFFTTIYNAIISATTLEQVYEMFHIVLLYSQQNRKWFIECIIKVRVKEKKLELSELMLKYSCSTAVSHLMK